jgi:hypothetical protein
MPGRSLLIDCRRLPLTVRARPGRIAYRLTVDAPGVESPVPVRIEIKTATRPWRPRVYVRAPECLRHRYNDGALCMWRELDSNEHRWVLSDGIEALVHHIRRHLHQEAACRAGLAWPGAEAPGEHPRPTSCVTCGGHGP